MNEKMFICTNEICFEKKKSFWKHVVLPFAESENRMGESVEDRQIKYLSNTKDKLIYRKRKWRKIHLEIDALSKTDCFPSFLCSTKNVSTKVTKIKSIYKIKAEKKYSHKLDWVVPLTTFCLFWCNGMLCHSLGTLEGE